MSEPSCNLAMVTLLVWWVVNNDKAVPLSICGNRRRILLDLFSTPTAAQEART